MSYNSLREVIEVIERELGEMRKSEPVEIRKMRTGTLDNQAGTNGQYFTTWDFANGMIRDHSMYTWYHLVGLAENEDFSLQQLCHLVDTFDHPYSNYLRYSGFPRLGELALALRKHLPDAASRAEAIEAVRSFCAYTNQLAAWSFHYFHWDQGERYLYADIQPVAPVQPDLSRRVHIRDGRKIRMTWEPLGISVDAYLAVNENPELCNDIIQALPFAIIQDHAVVSGESMYAWAPVVSTAPVHVKERQCDAPQGRIRYSQGTGNKIIVQYGDVTEDIATPVLGEIVPEHVDRLAEVGRQVLKSTFDTKELIWLKVELA